MLIVATSATDKARTAKLLEKRGDALVAMFYPPDLGTVTGAVREMAGAARRASSAATSPSASPAPPGSTSGLARSEVDKLALYLDASPQAPRNADAEALDAIGARTEEDGFAPLVNAVLSGEAGRLPGELRRMREVSLNPVGVLLAFERRAAQLAQLAAKLGPGGRVNDLLDAEQKAPPGVLARPQRPRHPAQALERRQARAAGPAARRRAPGAAGQQPGGRAAAGAGARGNHPLRPAALDRSADACPCPSASTI